MDFDLEENKRSAFVLDDEGPGEDGNDVATVVTRVAGEATPGDPDLRNIVRYGPGAGSGWRVTISRRSPQRVYGKTFADVKYGGEVGSLDAARAWRDGIEARHHGEPRRQRNSFPAAHNASGVTGVYRIVVWRRQADGSALPEYLWRAVTPSTIAPRRCRVFSVTRHGEEEAKRLAVEARRAFEAEAKTAVPELPSPELRGISRVERKLFGIWQVTLSRGMPGRSYKKPFSDLFYGDKQRALAAAQAWRDEMEQRDRELGSPPAAVRTRTHNPDGVTGVYRQRYVCRHADGSESVHFYWQARTPKGLKPGQSRTFYVSKYGEREAYRLAVEARRAFETSVDEVKEQKRPMAEAGAERST